MRATSLGAALWAARAWAELRPAGTSGVGALTAQERQIADLVAGGLSNKELGAKLFLRPVARRRPRGARLWERS